MRRIALALAMGATSALAQIPTQAPVTLPPRTVPVTSDSAFVRLLAAYKRIGLKPNVDSLVKLHNEIEDAAYAFEVGIAASYVLSPKKPLRLEADYSEIGVFPHARDTSALEHTSKLLREAHLIDPNSKFRSLTWFASLIPEPPDPADPLGIAASKEFLDEFNNTTEAKRVVVNLAHFYDDLSKMVRDSLAGPNKVLGYRMACFKPYFTKSPLDSQFVAARDSSVRYYNKALNLIPQNPSLREQRLLINGGNNFNWYFCDQ
jgi:hypothetical protein